LGLPTVGVDQRLVGFGEFACLKDGDGAATEELGSADAGFGGEGVQPADELVVELHKDFFASHAHMVQHMALAGGSVWRFCVTGAVMRFVVTPSTYG
jgi:hypothetical protein